MTQLINFIWSSIFQLVFRPITKLTGKSGGKFAKFLPKDQHYLLQNYCGLYKLNIDTLYPMESTIWLSGVYEATTTTFFKKVVRSGDIVLDVGANFGALTLVAASLLETGKIYAFEPSPTLCSRLQNNINLNPELKDIVQVVPLALGRKKSQLFYIEDQSYRGNGSLYESQGIPVDVISLDEWVSLNKLNKIDIIKIDTEGMEYDVLLGGKTVLEREHPIIYFETLPIFFENKPYTIKTIYDFLTTLDYKLVDPRKPYLTVPFDGPYPPNSVAIHSSRLERLR